MKLRILQAGLKKVICLQHTFTCLEQILRRKYLQKSGIIVDDTKEREEKLRPNDYPRCKTRNPIGAKYCFTCSMVLDHKLAIEVQEAKTYTIGQFDSTMMLEIMTLERNSA